MNWYGSNSDDRQEILNLIGEFTTENPLEFHLRKDGAIGRVRVFINSPAHGYERHMGKRRVLYKHMWSPDRKLLFHYPDQQEKAHKTLRVLSVLRCSHERFAAKWAIKLGTIGSELLLLPVIKKRNIPDRVDALSHIVNELVSTYPNDWKLTWDTPFRNRDYNEHDDTYYTNGYAYGHPCM